MPAMPDSLLSARRGELFVEEVALTSIADALGTPVYVYSAAAMRAAVADLQQAFSGCPTQIHYAVKANSNLGILALMSGLGCGFDIVSGGELNRVVAAGGDPGSVIFSGVGKSVEEIDLALKLGIGCFNVESAGELTRLSERARLLGKVAPVSVRVNPDVDANTHPYISTGLRQNKFGVSPEAALDLYQQAAASEVLEVQGIDCHIGSQIASVQPLLDALARLLELADELAAAGISLRHIDLGGGMGVTYHDEAALDVQAYGTAVGQMLAGRKLQVRLEPGRSIVANAGLLLTRVEYLKPASEPDAPDFAVVDAAMNDLIRPALYQAWHEVRSVRDHDGVDPRNWDIVGPVCETGDFIARRRDLALQDGSLLAILSAGAYGMALASNYNSRNRACEVLVDGTEFRQIRRRETIADQLRLEQGLQ